jgi:type IV secretion system protein VirB9
MRRSLTALGFMLTGIASANSNQAIANNYFSDDTPHLSASDKTALKIAKDWQKGKSSSKPFKSSDGAVSFVYGAGQTKIVCAVLQACDIALQPGEKFNDMSVGDPRFLIEPSITGSGFNQQIHLIVKPKDVGLDSSLVVATDKRTYHLRLKSTRHDYMPFVSFIYPDEAEAKWQHIKAIQYAKREANTFPQTHEYLGNLNFNYRLSGQARWKPVRVYNDGRKTIIEMPGAMKQTEAPALLLLKRGGLFQKDSHIMVNYRVQGSRYIVDSVFDSAVLLAGSGSTQQKITITRC